MNTYKKAEKEKGVYPRPDQCTAYVIMLDERYFYEIKKTGVFTAHTLAGAELFQDIPAAEKVFQEIKKRKGMRYGEKYTRIETVILTQY